MHRGFICLGLSATLAGSVPLAAQDFNGTYMVRAPAGNTVTLVLRQDQSGRITGELTGNEMVVHIEGRLDPGGTMVGSSTTGTQRGFAAASLLGDSLQLMFADFGPDGNPDFSTAGAVILFKAGTKGAPAPAPTTPATPEPRPKGTGQPGARPSGAAQATDADRQLSQLLLGSPWCSFQYSQTSGRTSTSRYTFLPDGTVSFGTNTEGGTTNQSGGGTVNLGGGATGSVYSQSKGGGRLRWKVQQGMLHLDDGKGFQPVALRVTRNSNGYPIITADGTEYSQCN